jgi:cytochrome c553
MRSWYWLAVPLLAASALAFAEDRVQTDLYTVVDGIKVDENTMEGFRTWRAAACDRCHGANQEGMVGPSLLESLKVMSNLDNLYAYLKGRSDGAITRAKVQALK